MWQDETIATEHYNDLVRVRKRVDTEPLQDFYNADECKVYRLKVIDHMIKESVLDMKPKLDKGVYR